MCGESIGYGNFKSVGALDRDQDRESVFLTLPSAISLNATTTSRLSDSISGFAPLKSSLARLEASITNSNRLVTL
jgi:hypothetical protein